MPTHKPTLILVHEPEKACFDRLAVTSAWKGKDDKQRKLDPQAGMTFLLDIPVNGRFEPRVLIA